jgi:hypothetical protein
VPRTALIAAGVITLACGIAVAVAVTAAVKGGQLIEEAMAECPD